MAIVNADFNRGRIEALEQAAALMRNLEAAVARRLDRESCRATRDARRVRHKAFGVAAKRIETLVRRERRAPGALPATLEELGLG